MTSIGFSSGLQFEEAPSGLFWPSRRFFDDIPSEGRGKVVQAALADPPVVVFAGVAMVKHVFRGLRGKFGSAKGAVVVVPICVTGVLFVTTVIQSDSSEVLFLTVQSPVIFVCHGARGDRSLKDNILELNIWARQRRALSTCP